VAIVKQIVSRDNPDFKALKSLATDSREQRRQRRTLIEGAHIVAAYRDKLGSPERLIVSEHGAAQAEIQSLCATLPEVETLLLRDSLFNMLSGLATPVGILAEIRIPEATGGIAGSCVLLDELQDAGNVGSIFRSAAAAGIADVFLGTGCAGAWTPRVLRAAQGAHFSLRIREQADLAKVMVIFPGLTVAATAHGEESLYRLDLKGDVAWLLGSEGRGIAPHLEVAAARRISIPMASGSESLNVAAAAAICFFEKVRQSGRRNDV
jgi:TrmH family RNA methyltransferase